MKLGAKRTLDRSTTKQILRYVGSVSVRYKKTSRGEPAAIVAGMFPECGI
jgi:hypothetical protein